MPGTDTPPRPQSSRIRNILAGALGAVAYFLVMYRFQTYTERNHMPAQVYLAFVGVIFLIGLVIGFFCQKKSGQIGFAVISGVFAAHATIIWLDLQEDPTNHNLLPFEFAYFFVLGSPAWLGAWTAGLLRRLGG